eukprot:gene43246-52860_t
MTFQWSCRVSSVENHGLLCTEIFASSNLLSDTVFVSYTALNASATYEVSVSATAVDGRRGSASIAVIKQDIIETGANTAIKSTFQEITIDFPMAVYGFVQAPIPIVAEWSAFAGGQSLDLNQMSTTPARNKFYRNNSLATIPYPLSLRVQNVVKGSTMTFRLSSYDEATNRLLSYSDINVVAAPSPVGGRLTVSPTTGIGFTTVFTFTTADWVDDSGSSLPLQYDFRYINPTQSAALTIQVLGPSTVASCELPPGIEDDLYRVTVISRAFNSLNAYGSVSTTVAVSERPANSSLTTYLSDGLALARATNNTNAAVSVVNNVLSVLSEVNCSSVSSTYCSSLNRSPCRTVSQTCGECLAGYSGVAGDANNLCSPVNDPLLPIGSACSSNSSCFYGFCLEGLCAEPLQTCPSVDPSAECSGHGECSYRYDGAACQFSQTQVADRIEMYSQSCDALIEVAGLSALSASLLD